MLLRSIHLRPVRSMSSSSHTALLPPRLCTYIHKKLAASCPPGTALDSSALLNDLAAAAPPDADLNTWIHRQASQVFMAIEKNPSIATALADGEITLLDAVAYNANHRDAARLREQPQEGGGEPL